MNDNLAAFLKMIRACEGTDSDDGYRALFGYRPGNGRLFDNDFARHPNIKFPFRQTDGQMNESSAAGAYQFIHRTWEELRVKLKLPDFSPSSQDMAAEELIAECGAMGDVKDGKFQSAIDKCASKWASLPASTYKQPKKTTEFALNAYMAAGGMLA